MEKEGLLQYAWEQRRFDAQDLHTTDGQAITIVKPGRHNPNQGPDFLEAHIRIDGLDVFGAVEIHVNGKHWATHQHDKDAGYNGVVLHVVGQGSKLPVRRADDTFVPEVVIGDRLDAGLLQRYAQFEQTKTEIPCRNLIADVADFYKRSWVRSLGMGRVVAKATAMEKALGQVHHNWQEVFWQELAGALAGPVNKEAFKELATRLPVAILTRHAADITVVEALLFGTAGLLNVIATDEYQATLQTQWDHYRAKYNLMPLPTSRLLFMRMRPGNFPTIRLAQLAALLHHSPNLLTLLDVPAVELASTLQSPVSEYWQTHFHFGKRSKRGGAHLLTPATVGVLLINTLLPFAMVYNRYRKREDEAQYATEVLQSLKPESNAVVARYAALGLKPANGLESQGLLALYKDYCTPKRCLACGIGHQILKKA
jgi:hypothetical protein